MEHRSLSGGDFSELPANRAINLWVENLDSSVQKAMNKKELTSDAEDILIDLFQIWNYRLYISRLCLGQVLISSYFI
ncbi:Uncharacterized protein XB16_2291 [Leptospira santarosai]|uniref:Uncharacterized protein n=1 Tax=Leptospira santarosai TaxID=28183 RepID=A0A2P1QUM6_9LEPT|nr:Uncharacterized protein XB16_2291 [Leptospira santarosai]